MVSIILFNTQIHYCIFRNNMSFEIYTVPNTEEPYIPAPRDVIVALKSRGEPVFALLENLEQIAANIPVIPSLKKSLSHSTRDVCFYCAVESAYKCMQNIGGKIIFVLSTLPSCGLNSLHENMEKRMHSGKSLNSGDAVPLKDALTCSREQYTDLGVKCALSHVSVDGCIAT